MKKMLSMLAIAAIAVGCSKSDSLEKEVVYDGANDIISFAPTVSIATNTRALIGADQIGGADSTEILETLAPSAVGGTFHVVAYKTASQAEEDLYLAADLSAWDAMYNPLFFSAGAIGNGDQGTSGVGLVGNALVNAGPLETLYFWPVAKDQKLDFYAYFAKEGATNVKAQLGSYTKYDYTMGATPAAQCDVLIADSVQLAKSAKKAVAIKFHHAMSMVQFVFASTVKTSYSFQKVVIKDYTEGTFDITKDVNNTIATGVIVDINSTKEDITNDMNAAPIAALKYEDEKATSYTDGRNLSNGTTQNDADYMAALATSSVLIFPEAAASGLKKTAVLTFAKGSGASAVGTFSQDVDLKAPGEGFMPGKVYQYVIKYDGKVIEIGQPLVVDWIAVDAGQIEL